MMRLTAALFISSGLLFVNVLGVAQEKNEERLDNVSVEELSRELKKAKAKLRELEENQKALAAANGVMMKKAMRWSIRTELSMTNFRPELRGLDFAIHSATGTRLGELAEVSTDQFRGRRIGMFFSAPTVPLEFGLRTGSQDNTWQEIAVDAGAGDLWETRLHPLSRVDDAIASAAATYRLDLEVVEFEVARTLDFSDGFSMRVSGGVRRFEIENMLIVHYREFAPLSTTFTSMSNTAGIGPFMALDIGLNLPAGFRLGARVGVSLLKGDTEYLVRDDAWLLYRDSQSASVPVLEYALDLSWSIQHDGFFARVSVGYEGQTWQDVYRTSRAMDDIDPTLVTNEEYDIDFAGLAGTISFGKIF